MKSFFAVVFASLVAATVQAEEQLTQSDVQLIVAQATTAAAQIDPNAIIAVVDREGFILTLWDVNGQFQNPLPQFPPPTFALPNLLNPAVAAIVRPYALVGGAVTRAISAAFLSSAQNAFTSRTAGYIIQQHFPVGVSDTSNGPLVGVGLSSLFFSDVNTAKLILPRFNGAAMVSSTVSPGIRPVTFISPKIFSLSAFPLTTLSDSPGGLPLYKHGRLVGGIGVTGDGSPTNFNPAGAIIFNQVQHDFTSGFKAGHDTDEDVALAGQTGFAPSSAILATNVLIGGIRIPYVAPDVRHLNVDNPAPLGAIGRAIDVPTSSGLVKGAPQASPAEYPYQPAEFGGTSGEIRFPFRDDPLAKVPGRQLIAGRVKRLTIDEVTSIISKSSHQNGMTRAGIRLPIGTPAKNFIVVVNNPDKAGEAPAILGIFRTGEATIFSWDVAAQKARTAVFFSNSQLAVSSRTLGFLAQRWFPPGIDGQPPGPFFGFQEAVSLKRSPKTAPLFPETFPGDPNVPNGVTIFPGGFPLYRDGQVVGAVGVSGDGIDQDDLIACAGTVDFLAKQSIRADEYTYHGARLPYAKFPRDPDIQ